MQEIPLEGRKWLPPDCESGRRLLMRLAEFHEQCAKSIDHGIQHVAYHRQKATQAHCAIDRIFDTP
jgi:hypothetical protein